MDQEKMTDAEFVQMVELMRKYANTEMDQWERWRLATDYGQIFINISRTDDGYATDNLDVAVRRLAPDAFMIPVHDPSEIPDFADDAEATEFWSTHTWSDQARPEDKARYGDGVVSPYEDHT